MENLPPIATLSNGDCIPNMNFELSHNARCYIKSMFYRMNEKGITKLTLKP